MNEDDILRLIRSEFETLAQERGVIIPRCPLDRLPGAKNNEGTAYIVPNASAGKVLVISDGNGNWNEYQTVGPVS